MAITPLPSPPLITDAPDVFDTKASAHVASLSQLVTEMNAAIAAVNMTKWISGTTYAIGDVTWSPITFYAYRRKTAGAGTTDPSADGTNWIGIISAAAGANSDITSMTALTAPTVAANPVRAADLQVQSVTAFTTGGTSTAFTLTPTPAMTANAANQRFRVKFNAAAGATPTLAVSGLTALNLTYKDSTGTKQAITAAQVPSGWISDVENDGTDWVVLNPVSDIGGRLLRITRYTTPGSGTWTKPVDTNRLLVYAVGGGGGGGGGLTGSNQAGNGGYSGCYGEKLITAPAASYSYTVGAAGSGGAVGAAGSAGGQTSFGAMTLTGGPGGQSALGALVALPTGDGWDFTCAAAGAAGHADSTSNVHAAPGAGGASPFAGGGSGSGTTTIPGSYGSGGGGGPRTYGTGYAGSAGGAGYIEIWEFA